MSPIYISSRGTYAMDTRTIWAHLSQPIGVYIYTTVVIDYSCIAIYIFSEMYERVSLMWHLSIFQVVEHMPWTPWQYGHICPNPLGYIYTTVVIDYSCIAIDIFSEMYERVSLMRHNFRGPIAPGEADLGDHWVQYKSSEKSKWGGGYLRNHLAHRNGSPIKMYRMFQGVQWKYFMHCIFITTHSNFHMNIKYMLCKEVFFPIIPLWPCFSARLYASQLDPWAYIADNFINQQKSYLGPKMNRPVKVIQMCI